MFASAAENLLKSSYTGAKHIKSLEIGLYSVG